MSAVETVTEEQAGQRLDVVAAMMRPDASRSSVAKMIKEGAVTLNGHVSKPKEAVQTGDLLEFLHYEAPAPNATPEDLPLTIVYEDDVLLVVNKAQGMTTHPAPGSPGGTLVNALLGRGVSLSEEGGALRPGIVHRLDKDTSGLLVVAKTQSAHLFLARQLSDRTLSRRYLALLWGVPQWRHARVDAPIGRHPSNRQKMAVVAAGSGRTAITDLDLIEALGPVSLVRARLQSGRTHQIRVHSAYAGHPVVGDPLYGGARPRETRTQAGSIAEAMAALRGQALHAAYLKFVHPVTREHMAFAVAPPAPFRRMLNALNSGLTDEELLTEIRAEPKPEEPAPAS